MFETLIPFRKHFRGFQNFKPLELIGVLAIPIGLCSHRTVTVHPTTYTHTLHASSNRSASVPQMLPGSIDHRHREFSLFSFICLFIKEKMYRKSWKLSQNVQDKTCICPTFCVMSSLLSGSRPFSPLPSPVPANSFKIWLWGAGVLDPNKLEIVDGWVVRSHATKLWNYRYCEEDSLDMLCTCGVLFQEAPLCSEKTFLHDFEEKTKGTPWTPAATHRSQHESLQCLAAVPQESYCTPTTQWKPQATS